MKKLIFTLLILCFGVFLNAQSSFSFEVKGNYFLKNDSQNNVFTYGRGYGSSYYFRDYNTEQSNLSGQVQFQYFINPKNSIGLIGSFGNVHLGFYETTQTNGSLVEVTNDPNYSTDKEYLLNELNANFEANSYGGGLIFERYFDLSERWRFSFEQSLGYSSTKLSYNFSDEVYQIFPFANNNTGATYYVPGVSSDTTGIQVPDYIEQGQLDTIPNGMTPSEYYQTYYGQQNNEPFEVELNEVNQFYSNTSKTTLHTFNYFLTPNLHLKVFKNSYLTLSVPILEIQYSYLQDENFLIPQNVLYSHSIFDYDRLDKVTFEPNFNFRNVFLGWNFNF